MSANGSKTRRSFLTELLTRTAGAWLAVTGGALFGAGCSSSVRHGEGSASEPGFAAGEGPVATKYGGRFELETEVDEAGEAAPVPEPVDAGEAEPVVVKYGGPPEPRPEPAPQPATKYGGRPGRDSGTRMTKYGGPR